MPGGPFVTGTPGAIQFQTSPEQVAARAAAEQAQSSVQQSAVREAQKSLGIPDTSQPMDQGEILSLLESTGVDITDSNVQLMAQQWAQNGGSFSEQQSVIQNSLPFLPAKPLPAYGQAAAALDLPENLFQPAPGVSQLYAHEQLGKPPPARDYVDLKDKGVMYFSNGVIYNYASTEGGLTPGTVIFDNGDAKQEGSYAWLRNAQTSWSDTRVQAWREQLYKDGFLNTKKGKGWTSDLIAATNNYYQAKYIYPDVEPHGTGGPGAVTGQPTKQDIAAMVQKNLPVIKNAVHDQYLSVFNDAPSNDELQSWSRFVVQKATELATTGPKDERLSPEAAMSTASAAAELRLKRSPQAQQYIESYKENTSLHDALTTAISATRGLA